MISLKRRAAVEGLGTTFLLIAVVGSGILAERLATTNPALTLLASALATGAALFALIEWLSPLSGAHFNPLVTLALFFRGDLSGRAAATYVLVQMAGAVAGVGVADGMFDAPAFSLSTHVRSGPSQLLGEFVSTFGLVGAVWVCSQTRPSSLAGVVAAYIFGVFWFTPTGFANPAVTIARALTDTFSGIRPADVPGFVAAETAGAVASVAVFRWLTPERAHRRQVDILDCTPPPETGPPTQPTSAAGARALTISHPPRPHHRQHREPPEGTPP